MVIYLAGFQATNPERELRLIQSGVVKHRCFSFVYVQKVPGIPYYCKSQPECLDLCIQNRVGIMMDSGVFSLRMYKKWLNSQGKNSDAVSPQAFMDLYIEYCRGNHKKWDWFATTDWTPNAPEIYKTQKYLLSRGIKPTPVFHGDSDIEYIKRYHDLGHNFIAIGAGNYIKDKRKHLDAVFSIGAKLGVEYHGLAMTSVWQTAGYPWRSADSSSWSRTAGFGVLMRFNPETDRISTLHVSERVSTAKMSINSVPRDMLKRVKRELADEGYDYEELRTDLVTRHIYNAHTMLKLSESATKRHGQLMQWNPVI